MSLRVYNEAHSLTNHGGVVVWATDFVVSHGDLHCSFWESCTFTRICIFNKHHQHHPHHPCPDDSVQVIRVHILRNTGIVEIEKIWICFPNLIFINCITSENYLTLFRFLFLSCRTEMAKHYLFRRLKCGGIHYSRKRVYFYDCSSRSYVTSSYEAFFIPLVSMNYALFFAPTACLYFYLAFISFSLTQLIY